MEKKTINFIDNRAAIVQKIAEKVRVFEGSYEFHGGSYSDGQLIQTTDGNRYHIVNIQLLKNRKDGLLLDIEVWSSLTENFYINESDVTTESLQSILDHIQLHEISYERHGSKNPDKQQLLYETIALLSADIYEKVYACLYGWGATVEAIVQHAKEFEEQLDWQPDDKRDYIEELESFEKKLLEETYNR